MSFGKIVFCALISFVFLTIGGGAVYFLPPKFTQLAKLESKRNELMLDIDQRKTETEALKVMQKRFEKDADFVEFVARQNRRIRDNELLFIRDNNVEK